jgi:hypothetical protein
MTHTPKKLNNKQLQDVGESIKAAVYAWIIANTSVDRVIAMQTAADAANRALGSIELSFSEMHYRSEEAAR